MTVLTLASRKGGTGKSTISIAIAAMLAAEGCDVALVDTDPTEASFRWVTEKYSGGGVLASYAEADTEALAILLPRLSEIHAVLIIDTAGFGNQAATVAMGAADAVLVPVTPGEGDVVEAGRTIGFVEGLARMARRPIPIRVLPNRMRRTTNLTRHVLEELDAMNLPRMASTLSDSVGYGELSFSGGLHSNGTMANEIAALVQELRGKAFLPALDMCTTLLEDMKQ